jgi:hypothetical protein
MPEPSGPNNVPDTNHRRATFLSPTRRKNQYSQQPPHDQCQIIDDPPLSNPHNTDGCEKATWTPFTNTPPRWAGHSDASAP